MDEKADATPPVPPEEEANSVSDEHDEDTLLSAGNDNEHGSPTDAAELSPAMDTDPLAPTDTTQTETEAAVATNDSLASETTGTPLDSFISSDALSVADALTSVDDLRSAEELTSENVQASASSVLDKISSVDTSASSVVCQLEEELKRLHEGDPLEDIKPEENIATDEKSVVEKQAEKPEAEVKPQIVLKTTSVIARPMIKPVVELTKVRANPDEMLSAESIAKDPLLIRRAQADLKITDVLVCGKCHEVFHFAEEFQKHKTGSFCTGKSHLLPICESESKPQVWGFTLWKHKYNKLLKDGDSPIPSSWAIYQKWCKLPQPDKNAWITAGQTIQFCTKIGTSKVTEVRAKVVPKPIERDPLALDGFAESNKENSAIGNGDAKPSEVVRRSIIRPVRLNNDVTILPKKETDSNKALRTVKSTETREYAVERIVAKRFNSKRKCFEYQIKWEHFPSEENTWEPISNLNHCKQMVAEFEEQLKMLKAEKAKQQASVLMARGIHTKPFKPSPIVSTASSSFGNDSTPGRPTRTSKQKALNQVKAWCGNISEDEGSGKRPREDDDSDESFEKRIKYEDFSDDSDVDVKPKLEVKPKITYRRIQPKPTPPVQKLMRNGLDAMTPLPQNVLIPDANGVVRINQKQLPSLSTGVYIMSKTAGIIKLDSTTSKVATSGGQTIVKVAPKVGQTQIKIVKKDGQTTTTKQIIQMAPNKSVSSTPTTLAKSTFKPVITKVKRVGEGTPRVTVLPKSKPVATKIIVKPKDETKQQQPVQQAPPPPTPPQQKEEESDDGLEELPFPDEIKVPEPESPPSEFVLDPITGKIAGREYPEPVPEPEHTKMETEDNSLENIVKLAAADITEDDLKNESDEAPVQTQVVARPPVQPPKKVETFKRIISSPHKTSKSCTS
ncbi:hypothetical protein NQ315_005176 [Exocentrus adspersus]|uniref:Chromo domain-containing protein n=1 Tax=Exocentrus adspersus TaxID=1586481 RepID=A0AAV8VUJ2_9CUCU|nr:hypothetical protein NQ315_005176 [Exocentrus adspersus]